MRWWGSNLRQCIILNLGSVRMFDLSPQYLFRLLQLDYCCHKLANVALVYSCGKDVSFGFDIDGLKRFNVIWGCLRKRNHRCMGNISPTPHNPTMK